MQQLETVKQAADRIGIPEATLRFYIYKGTAPRSFKLGGRRMFGTAARTGDT